MDVEFSSQPACKCRSMIKEHREFEGRRGHRGFGGCARQHVTLATGRLKEADGKKIALLREQRERNKRWVKGIIDWGRKQRRNKPYAAWTERVNLEQWIVCHGFWPEYDALAFWGGGQSEKNLDQAGTPHTRTGLRLAKPHFLAFSSFSTTYITFFDFTNNASQRVRFILPRTSRRWMNLDD